jgi:hypothetical protein
MINLQKEMSILLKEIWNTVIVRIMTDTKCFCWRIRSNTADPECPNCEGSGYIFNEHISKCKLFYAPANSVAHAQDFDYGISYSNTNVLYFEVSDISENIRINDEVFEVKTHTNGTLYDPIIRTKKWTVIDPYKFSLDTGKREFVKVFAKPSIV